MKIGGTKSYSSPGAVCTLQYLQASSKVQNVRDQNYEKLHPCNATLNSRNLGFTYGLVWTYDLMKDSVKASSHRGSSNLSFKKSSGFIILATELIKTEVVLQT